MEVGGFRLRVRPAEAGGGVGILESQDSRTEVFREGSIHYIQHTKSGTKADEPGILSWNLWWTAPPGGRITFIITANASNDDDSPLGDFIYVQEFESRPADRR